MRLLGFLTAKMVSLSTVFYFHLVECPPCTREKVGRLAVARVAAMAFYVVPRLADYFR